MEKISDISLLSAIEKKITETRENKIQLLNIDKEHPELAKINARLSSLILIKSELIRKNKNNNEYHLSLNDEIALLNQMAEKRKQNIVDYSRNGREELAEAENQELSVIEEFLPKMPTDDEIKEFIGKIIDDYAIEQGITSLSMRDMGKIKVLVNDVYPTVNGGIIKDVLMSKINA